jgi:hypothetical protein
LHSLQSFLCHFSCLSPFTRLRDPSACSWFSLSLLHAILPCCSACSSSVCVRRSTRWLNTLLVAQAFTDQDWAAMSFEGTALSYPCSYTNEAECIIMEWCVCVCPAVGRRSSLRCAMLERRTDSGLSLLVLPWFGAVRSACVQGHSGAGGGLLAEPLFNLLQRGPSAPASSAGCAHNWTAAVLRVVSFPAFASMACPMQPPIQLLRMPGLCCSAAWLLLCAAALSVLLFRR